MSIERRLKRDVFAYLFLNNEFFENLGNYEPNLEYYKFVKNLLNDTWRIEKKDIWFVVYPYKCELPPQGWKIHISGTILNAIEILRTVVPFLTKEKAAFKFLCDSKILYFVNSKNYNRAGTGKFITIYPKNEIDFKYLIEALYSLTKKFVGPYILSDKRYKDSRCIFYRYGGYIHKWTMNVFGEKVPAIISPSGELIPDERLPYFYIPKWVNDPFEKEISKDDTSKNELVLNTHYLIEKAIIFSNKGGVYKGKDLRNDNPVIIKEARPLVDLDHEANDAITVLEKEFKVLKKMDKTEFVPKPIDYFREWEHCFLVEEYIDGIPLTNYRAVEGIGLILRKNWSKDTIADFYEKICKITEQIIHAMLSFHKNGIIIGDVSPGNILINTDTLKIKFIDFEGACFVRNNDGSDSFPIFTSGFASPQRIKGEPPIFEDDYYALGALIYSMILPVNEIFKYDKFSINRFLNEFLKDTGLPTSIQTAVFGLMNENPSERLRPEQIIPILKTKKVNNYLPLNRDCHIDSTEIKRTIDGIMDYIYSTATFERTDRLWPVDYRVFTTGPLNIAYGALGIAYFLEKEQRLMDKVKTWIMQHPINSENYPPGLYVGLAGIAWVLYEIGFEEKAREIMEILYKHPLLFSGFDIFYGVSGWGLASIYFYLKTKEEKYLDESFRAGEFLIKSAQNNGDSCYWKNVDGIIYVGLAHGASGAALFLLYLYLVNGDKRFLKTAIKALEFDLSQAICKEDYITFPRAIQDKNFLTSYWQYGSAGVGTVSIRFYKYLEEKRYLEMALLCAKDAHRKYAVQPYQFRGLSGMGE
ncbi:MAG: class III lanthionine synthetase LanKC, partial [candidate division WOR-3 bacterium]